MTGSNPPPLTEALLASLQDPHPLNRVLAATAVARAGDLRALGPLPEAVDHPLRRQDPARVDYVAAYAALAQLIDAAGEPHPLPPLLRREAQSVPQP
jgi:hypothetical protein